jgi:cytochrome c oxidase subunit 2
MQALKHLLLRAFFTLLFLAVPVLGIWTFVKAPDWNVWFPESVSSYGGEIDRLFWLICWMVAIVFVLTEMALVYFFFVYSKRDRTRAAYTHGNHTLEMVWTAIPAVLLLVVAFSQMGTWAKIKMNLPEDGPYSGEHPLMQVYASQFDWRAVYPDREGNFRGADLIESPYDIYVPVDTKVIFTLHSRDVLHSFFVPSFRLKQDAVPGMAIPVWFEATKVGAYDLVCAELCGWGHYKMAGKIHVLSKDDFDAWLEGRRAALYSNGSED